MTTGAEGEAMPGTVLYERVGNVATITYNRPEVLNAINAERGVGALPRR